MLRIHRAKSQDLTAIVKIDRLAREDKPRRKHIRRAISAGELIVARTPTRIVGYVILKQSFYDNDFVSLLLVDEKYRRAGIGSALMKDAERRGVTEKLFTSTNQSNRPMRKLLAKLGYVRSGIIHNLDPGDPELVYFKPRIAAK